MINRLPRDAGRREGERQRDNALALLAARRERFVRSGQRAALLRLLDGADAVTADDIRERVELPEGIDPRLFGAVPRPLALAGIIRVDGYVKSCRPERHASVIAVWRLADALTARQWLDTHPELPEPEPEPPGDDLPLFHEKSRPTVAPVERLEIESPTTQEGKSNGPTI